MDASLNALLTVSISAVLAAATFIYALATRNLALATRENTRAQIVSGARIAWVDAVRDAVAELLSLDAQLKPPGHILLPSIEVRDNLIQRRLMIRHQIEFRLDPEKKDHIDLLAAIDTLLQEGGGPTRTEAHIRHLTVKISEAGWRRVRREVQAPISAEALGRGVTSPNWRDKLSRPKAR